MRSVAAAADNKFAVTGRDSARTQASSLERDRDAGVDTTKGKENTMRAIMTAALLTAALGGSSAFAQSTYVHHNFCLKTGSATECAYDSFEQCEAAKRGNTDFCQINSAPQNHY
jgi:hypothetical protein